MRMQVFGIGLAVLLALAVAGPARAELCAACRRQMFIANIGKCVECGAFTSSGAFKLCRACSAKLGQCEHCRASLKPASGEATTNVAAVPPAAPAVRAPTPAGQVLEVGEADNGGTVKTVIGQRLHVTLPGNITTGFAWEVLKTEGTSVAPVGKVAYEQSNRLPHVVGSGGRYVAAFVALRPGVTKVEMGYRRSWEKGVPPAKVFSVTFDVAAP